MFEGWLLGFLGVVLTILGVIVFLLGLIALVNGNPAGFVIGLVMIAGGSFCSYVSKHTVRSR